MPQPVVPHSWKDITVLKSCLGAGQERGRGGLMPGALICCQLVSPPLCSLSIMTEHSLMLLP